jgi:predicted nucleotidyltransferase
VKAAPLDDRPDVRLFTVVEGSDRSALASANFPRLGSSMSLSPRLDDFPLADEERRQLAEIVRTLDEVLGRVLIGAYLHGSAVLGALHPHSDIDVLAVSSRETTPEEKDRLIDRMLEISGRYPATGPPRPIELTVVVESEVHPWRYPPQRDLQYGEWLREGFERHDPELWRPVADPDLAVLCTMALLGDAALVGPPPSQVIDGIPWADYLDASLAEIPGLVADIAADPRNVVLTLVRIWSSVVSGHVLAKDGAAEWALPRLPVEHRPVVARARDIYLGKRQEDWDDLLDVLPGFADAVAAEIRLARSTESPR